MRKCLQCGNLEHSRVSYWKGASGCPKALTRLVVVVGDDALKVVVRGVTHIDAIWSVYESMDINNLLRVKEG